jgi:hypothetical protein
VVVSGDGIPTPNTTMAVEAMTSLATSEAVASDLVASSGPAFGAPSSPPHVVSATASMGTDDNTIEELEVIMGHPGLRAPRTVSLSEAMGMTHFVLNQAHDVLCREREDINEERLHLSVWVSLLKQRMTSEKEKAEARHKCLDVMEVLYNRRQAMADKLNAQTQKLVHDAKELYAVDEGHANATINQQEDHNAQATTMAQREQAVVEQDLKPWEREEQDDLRIKCKLEALASCDSDFNNNEATLVAERKDLEETRAVVLARELTTDIRDAGLNSSEEKLGDREKRLAGREQQLVGR